MSTIVSIIAALLLLCLLVFVHELGHYAVGKFFGFGIIEFSIGFGARLWSRVGKDGVRYSLKMIPLGGSCSFIGEDEINGEENPKALYNQKAWKRFLMQAAGPAMNILFAFFIAIVVFISVGDYAPVVKEIVENSSAQEAGLLPGDVIMSVDGQTAIIDTFSEKIAKADSNKLTLEVLRDGHSVTVELHDLYDANKQQNVMGIMMEYKERKLSVVEALTSAVDYTRYLSLEIFRIFGNLVKQPSTITEQVSGPVGTVTLMGEIFQRGNLSTIARLAILISVNLGIFNLIPIPGLDGSRMIFSLIEIIFRKPVPRNVENIIHLAGFALLMIFVLFVTYSDISKLITGM